MALRTARCGCGRFQVDLEGDPAVVAICHCDFCQKRTGSLFGASAFFGRDQVADIRGEPRRYNGFEADGVAPVGGDSITYYFCPVCGSTLYWESMRSPELIVLAVGNLVDPSFVTPSVEAWTQLRHDWLPPVAGAIQFDEFPPGMYREP